jgi:hypothetical protein
VFGGAASLTLVALLLLVTLPVASGSRGLIVLLLAAGWAVAGCRWAVRRFGTRGALASAGIALALGGGAGAAVWLDGPNRRAASQVEEIPGCYAATTGTVLTGLVDSIYVNSKASDEGVRRLTELDGLDGLRTLLIREVRISDATARRLARFSRLSFLTLERTGVSAEAVEQLRRDLPRCHIEVR